MNKEKIREFFSPKNTKGKIFLVLLFTLSTILLFLPVFFDIDLQTFTTLGLVGLFIINFLGSATIFLPTPAILSVAVAAIVFNPIIVALVAAVASSLGEAIAFIFGYSSMQMFDSRKHENIFRITKALVHWKGGILIPVFALIPNPFFDGLGILAGMSGFPIKNFLLFTFFGRFVRNIGIVYLGVFLWQ